ncbi:hypothetical protein BH09PLA1_BH09PLA1_34840 [soil metagenome]
MRTSFNGLHSCVFLLGVSLTGISAWAAPAPTFTVVDVIPKAQSAETAQNSEPNIAVKPFANNATKIIIESFGVGGSPLWATTDGGVTWAERMTYPSGDTTVAWSPSGDAAYMSTLRTGLGAGGAQSKIETWKIADPTANDFAVIDTATFTDTSGAASPSIADQPWIAVGRNAADNKNRLYVSYNDITRFSNTNNKDTAAVRFFDDGVASATTVLDLAPSKFNGPPTRTVTAGAKVYSAFHRITDTANPDFTGDIVVTRDENRGANNFNKSSNVASGVTLPQGSTGAGTKLGVQKCRSSVSIAVHPSIDSLVYVSYADVTTVSGTQYPRLHVRRSTDGGQTWDATNKYDLVFDTAMPSLAVSTNGVVGLLYEEHFTGTTRLKTQFVELDQALNEIFSPVTLASFDETSLDSTGAFLVGDYFDLEAHGEKFLGTFSAANDPTFANFPQGAKFLRSLKDNPDGGIVDATHNFLLPVGTDHSIDPFFFSTIAVPEPGSMALLLFGGIALIRRRR